MDILCEEMNLNRVVTLNSDYVWEQYMKTTDKLVIFTHDAAVGLLFIYIGLICSHCQFRKQRLITLKRHFKPFSRDNLKAARLVVHPVRPDVAFLNM
jgi:hypothetical protein